MLIDRTSVIHIVFSFVFASFLNACGQAKSELAPELDNDQYHATITYTKYGVPHIKADDFSSLGFGVGYAKSRENLCTLADQIIKIKSQRAKYFGAGENNINLLSDVGYQGVNYIERAEVLYPTLGEKSRDMLEGYAAGYNKILVDLVSPDKYPSQCRGTNWVKKITAQELLAYQLDIAALSGSRNFLSAMAGSQSPQTQTKLVQNTLASDAASLLNMQRAVMTPSKGVGSNCWALGKDKVINASAALLANPHFPWDGDLRFFQQQLTIPDKLNVMGGTFISPCKRLKPPSLDG
ncbi:MAG: hypothetical protein HAW66_02730 [Shewanella sp.]|nr:hypothetical protein [Shewanella sp.]